MPGNYATTAACKLPKYFYMRVTVEAHFPAAGDQAKGLIMSSFFIRFLEDQSGATAIEYGLIAAGIAVAIIAVVQGLGTNLNATFSSVSSALK